jgi:hypothetical protein
MIPTPVPTAPLPTPVDYVPPKVEEVVVVMTTLEVDLTAVTESIGVDLTDVEEDLTEQPPEIKEKVQSFAADVAETFVENLVESLDVEASDVEVTCVYRLVDPEWLDLLTLSKSCKVASRRLDEARGLQGGGGGLGVQVEMVGDAVETIEEAGGVEQVTETLKEVEMTIETGCDDSGNGCTTLEAAVGDVIAMVYEREVPTPSPTPVPSPIVVEAEEAEEAELPIAAIAGGAGGVAALVLVGGGMRMMSKRASNKIVNTESHTVQPATVVDETGVPTQQDNFTNESEKMGAPKPKSPKKK